MKKPWLTCAQFAYLAELRLEGNPTRAQRVAMWLHLRICGPCNEHQHQLDETIHLLHELPQVEPPAQPSPAARSALMAAFREAKQH